MAYSPEREDPGNRDFATRNIPKVVGGLDETSQRLAVALYTPIVEGVVPVSSTRVAEACKILENTYRAVNIALVNELKVLYDRIGISVWKSSTQRRRSRSASSRSIPVQGSAGIASRSTRSI